MPRSALRLLDLVKKPFVNSPFSRSPSPVRSPPPASFDSGQSDAWETEDTELSDNTSDFSKKQGKMPKSNKFDYSNRGSSGPKLGGIIGRDLEKKAEEIQKKVSKSANSGRKSSTSSSSVLLEDAEPVRHVIDLKAPNKGLGDEGVYAMVPGIEAALQRGSQLALVDLNLAGNNLTTSSLACLVPLIDKSRFDLQTINLSNNAIRVKTDIEAQQFETFLKAFKDSYRLRRLDLSGNTTLGARAFEIIARVHAREAPADPMPAGGEASVLSLPDDATIPSMDLKNTTKTMTDGTVIKRRQGLRAFPYITIKTTGLNDAGAVWLSFVLEDHYYPFQLIDSLNAAGPDSEITTYKQYHTLDGGVEWDMNDATLTSQGANLLKKAELVRQNAMLAGDNDTLANSTTDHSAFTMSGSWDGSSPMENSLIERRGPRDRRTSVQSINSGFSLDHAAVELHAMRHKTQRLMIQNDGQMSVDLWRYALKTVAGARTLMILAPQSRKYYSGPPKFHMSAVPANNQAPVVTQPLSGPTEHTTLVKPGRAVDVSNGTAANGSHTRSSSSRSSGVSYAASLDRKASNSSVDKEITATTAKLKLAPRRKDTKTADTSNITAVTRKVDELTLRNIKAHRFIEYQQSWNDLHGLYRDESNPSHLPPHVVGAIIQHTLPDNQHEILDEQQMLKAVNWGMERENLKLVRAEWGRRDESSQVLMLLERIGCLTYG